MYKTNTVIVKKYRKEDIAVTKDMDKDKVELKKDTEKIAEDVNMKKEMAENMYKVNTATVKKYIENVVVTKDMDRDKVESKEETAAEGMLKMYKENIVKENNAPKLEEGTEEEERGTKDTKAI